MKLPDSSYSRSYLRRVILSLTFPVYLIWVAGMSLAIGQSTESQSRRISVTAITEEIVIDGNLDEAIWTSAPSIGELVQRQPNPGGEPSEETKVTLLHDADYLYIGVIAYDSELG